MSTKNIWYLDSTTYDPTKLDPSFIYQNEEIKQYLDPDFDNKFFLVGRKGVGKSLLLVYKYHLFREQHGKSYKYIPDGPRIEGMSINSATISKGELLLIQDFDTWVNIWKFTLLYVICKKGGINLNKEILNLVGSRSRISTVISTLLDKNISTISNLASKIIDLEEEAYNLQSGVVVFIDNIDQAFDKILTEYPEEDYYDPMNPSVRVWVNAQNGLMQAIYEINRLNPHLKIFTTIRQEAYNNFEGAISANLREYSTELKYDKDEIKQIFENRIKKIRKSDLFAPYKKSLVERFVGFSEMQHPFAMDEDNNKRVETVFDFLYRHTYGRPREILAFGKEILNLIKKDHFRKKDELNRKKDLRALINRISYETLFSDYQKEIIPMFLLEDFEKFVSKLPKNIIGEARADGLDKNLFKFYYNLGLIGHVREEAQGEYQLTQYFLPSSSYNYRKLIDVPTSKFYFTHPSIDQALINTSGNGYEVFYDRSNIIGNGYPFFTPKKIEKSFSVKHCTPSLMGDSYNKSLYRNALPMKDYYDNFFSSEDEKIQSKISNFPEDAKNVLNILGLHRSCKLLYAFTKDTFFEKKMRIQESQLTTYTKIDRQYRTPLGDSFTEHCSDNFFNKMFGRLIVIGAYSLIGYSCGELHHLLKNRSFLEDSHTYRGNTPITFLRQGLLIDGLVDDDNEEIKKKYARKKVFEMASKFEKDKILEWRISFLSSLQSIEWLDNTHLAIINTEVKRLRFPNF